jgi:NitT/TauT family transport system substrate-binding protein
MNTWGNGSGRSFRTIIRTLIVLIAMMMIVGGCASGSSSGGSSGGGSGSSGGSEARSSSSGDGEGNASAGKSTKKLIIAEPLHNLGYLPLYAAIHDGQFASRGLEVEVITATGGAHVTAVVSGDAWGVIGGPESNAMANRNNKDPIVSVVNVVNRANVYLMAAKGTGPASSSPEDLKEFLKGKRIAAGRHGGTPNLVTRYLLISLGLDPEKDVTLEEPADGSTVVSLMQQGIVDIANGAEPQIADGIAKGVWDEPFYKFPDLGDFSYSVLSVRRSAIDHEPETVQAFVEAVLEALKKVNEDPEFAREIASKEFPTLSESDVQASLDRAYEDDLWSKDGFITEEALKLDMDVMHATGIFTEPYTYDELIDMRFVNEANGQ